MLVFRDGRQAVSGQRVVKELLASLRQLSPTPSSLVDALIRAGELECALADAPAPAAESVQEVTDILARALVGSGNLRADECEQRVGALGVPETLTVSRPEGFAYYALHPLDYAEMAASLPVPGGRVAVLGIRSIGTTLSAVVTAAMRKERVRAERITVRPTGHPWDRRLELTPEEQSWICGHLRDAEFWVVDEGPGLSGSSFLAVGEALLEAGVSRERITFIGSAAPDPARLRARDAATRWARFRSYFVRSQRRLPAEAAVSVCGGQWRSIFLGASGWPATWPQFERLKFFDQARTSLFKFEGLGRFGREIRERSQYVFDAGFGPDPYEAPDGFVRYPVLKGEVMAATAVSTSVLEQMAKYCAWRARHFGAEPRPVSELQHMLATNLSEGLGEEYASAIPELRVERPVMVDGRMHPHEWRLKSDGHLLKLDGAGHGDDHFFPGPTDIAWDLAGTIVEWKLEPPAADFLVERYRRASGDDPALRLPGFLLAYTMFRLGYCAMAAESLDGTEEEPRFLRELEYCRALARAQLKNSAVAA